MACTEEQENEFQCLLDELSKLIIERDAALLSLSQVDEHLAALSTAIGLTSSGLNTPNGLLCMLRPISHLSDVLGSSKSSSNFLFELTLRNDSILSLSSGNWNIIVARLKPQESSVVHVAALPHIAAGSAWSGTLALDLSSSSLSEDTIDLAVFLCFTGADSTLNNNDLPVQKYSTIALLHVFRLDCLHSLQAGGGNSGAGSTFTTYHKLNSTSYTSASYQTLGIKLGVPKQFFGLDPEPQVVLDLVLKQGESSLPVSLKKQISTEKKERKNIEVSTGGGLNQRKQQKAVLHGELPTNYSLQNIRKSKKTSSAAVVGIQPAPFSLASASSPHAVLDLTCESGNLIDSLRLHSAALRRVQLLQTAVQESNSGADGGGGIQLGNGVIVPPACSFGALIDINEMEEISSKLNSLKEAAGRLRESLLAAEGQGEEQLGEGDKAAELFELVKSTRNLTQNIAITL